MVNSHELEMSMKRIQLIKFSDHYGAIIDLNS